MFWSSRILVGLIALILPISMSAQITDGLIELQRGSETVKAYKLDDSGQIRHIATANQAGELLTALPPEVMKQHPQLLGIFDFDGDGRLEVFVAWYVEIRPETHFAEFQAYRIGSEKIAVLFFESRIDYLPVDVYFPIVPGARKINAAVVRGLGGGYWGVYYVIFRDSKRLVEFTEGSRLKLGDLDGDGTYEWIMLGPRGNDLRCNSGILGLWQIANVFRLSGERFIQIWPLPDWIAVGGEDWGKAYMVTDRLYDMDDDGRPEIVASTDVRGNPQPRLSVYKLRQDHFDQVAYVNITPSYAVTEILGIRHLRDRKQVVLRLADSTKCHSYKWDEEGMLITEGFDFKNSGLERSWINEKLGYGFQGVVKDINGDGEEEMIFDDYELTPQGVPQKKPVLLRGIKEFLPYNSSK